MLYSLPVVAGTGRVHGSTVRLFFIGSFCDFFLCGVLATMQDEFTLARNPQPLTELKIKPLLSVSKSIIIPAIVVSFTLTL